MERRPIDLITISREFGAGGSELAAALGARLGWPVLDHELVTLVARRLGIEDRVVEVMDEHPPRLLARLASVLLLTPPEIPISLDTQRLLDPDRVAGVVRDTLLEAAQSPPLIIVGHGAQCLLHRRPGTAHVRLVAPIAARVARVCKRMGCNGTTAAAEVHRLDDDRRNYLRRYYHCDWPDPQLYDVVINTGNVPIDVAAEMVERLVIASREDALAPSPDAELSTPG